MLSFWMIAEERKLEMNELLTSIEPMLSKLSEVFCVSVDAIRTNAMEYVLMYSKYIFGKSILNAVITGSLIGIVFGIIGGVTGGVIALYLCENANISADEEESKVTKVVVICGVTLFILTVVFCCLSEIVPYLMSPEIYGLEQLINLVK